MIKKLLILFIIMMLLSSIGVFLSEFGKAFKERATQAAEEKAGEKMGLGIHTKQVIEKLRRLSYMAKIRIWDKKTSAQKTLLVDLELEDAELVERYIDGENDIQLAEKRPGELEIKISLRKPAATARTVRPQKVEA